MKKYTIRTFCEQHDACQEGKKWAIENCNDMDDAWNSAKPEWLIWIATCRGVLTDKENRLFAVYCARQVQHLMTDERSINAIDIAEKFANGLATSEELAAAWAAARAAARAATEAAAWAAARAAARAATEAAARAAAEAAARAAAWAAARAAAEAAARAAAWAAARAAAEAAARAAQAKWLRENTKPNFYKLKKGI